MKDCGWCTSRQRVDRTQQPAIVEVVVVADDDDDDDEIYQAADREREKGENEPARMYLLKFTIGTIGSSCATVFDLALPALSCWCCFKYRSRNSFAFVLETFWLLHIACLTAFV